MIREVIHRLFQHYEGIIPLTVHTHANNTYAASTIQSLSPITTCIDPRIHSQHAYAWTHRIRQMPYKTCQCEAYGCRQALRGYKEHADATYRRHQRAQKELESRQEQMNALQADNDQHRLEPTSSNAQEEPSENPCSNNESTTRLEDEVASLCSSPRCVPVATG